MTDLDVAALRKIAESATPGPWTWSEESDDNWGDCGPNLETVARGPRYRDGSQGAEETIVGSWGHDANGISVEPADALHIATFDPPTVLALLDRLERADREGYERGFRDGQSFLRQSPRIGHPKDVMPERHRATDREKGSDDA